MKDSFTRSRHATNPYLEQQIMELREWIEALTRRIEELEATTFQLAGEEEVIMITAPKLKKFARGERGRR